MKKNILFFVKLIAYVLILACCLHFTNRVLTPKYYYDNEWPTTTTYTGFYEIEKNSVDVLFLGSSHGVAAFLPQELYNVYGIRAYNLSCEQQNLLVSYYWLKEALRYQKPKVVVLDCRMLFEYNKYEPLNTAESCTRKAIDYMKWSSVKREAINSICENDKNQTALSYYFPNIRFHTRWTSLNENDFFYSEMEQSAELKGYAPLYNYCGYEDYVPLDITSSADRATMVPLMREYLDKITELCSEEGIELLLVKTPSTFENVANYNIISDYADINGLAFIDFNQNEIYEKMEYDFCVDNNDGGHLNIWGAKKVTDYLGDVIKGIGVQSREDKQWELSREYYEHILQDCELVHITDCFEYLRAIEEDRYSIFISVMDDAESNLRDDIKDLLANLGLQRLNEITNRGSYCAVISEDFVDEMAGTELVRLAGSVRNGRVLYTITSTGSASEKGATASSIIISGVENSKNRRGMNIVVYSNETHKVIDSVCIDTCAEDTQLNR